MLASIRLTDFKSFVDERATLSPLTLLVGANASGKSNFLDALRFLSQLPSDLTIAEILDGERRGALRWPGIRGGARETSRAGTSAFAIETTWRGPIASDLEAEGIAWPEEGETEGEAHLRVLCRTEPEPELEGDDLGRGQRLASWKGRAPGATRGGIGPGAPNRGRRPGGGIAVVGHVDDVVREEALDSALSHIEFVEINPAEMRGYGRRGRPLGENAANVSGVLAELCDDPEQRRTLVAWLAEICAPELVDIDFIEVPEVGDVLAVFVEKGGTRITAPSLSDGTLRFLGLLLALRTARPGSLVLLEEIEAGLHPTRIRLLVEYLDSVTRERHIQIVATTHSPVVLEWLSPGVLHDVLVFGRVPEHEGTLIRRLGDLTSFDEVMKRQGIDELFTTGWLELAL